MKNRKALLSKDRRAFLKRERAQVRLFQKMLTEKHYSLFKEVERRGGLKNLTHHAMMVIINLKLHMASNT